MIKVIVVVAGAYDFIGNGVFVARAVGDVTEAYQSVVASAVSAGDLRYASGQEITDAMANGKAF